MSKDVSKLTSLLIFFNVSLGLMQARKVFISGLDSKSDAVR